MDTLILAKNSVRNAKRLNVENQKKFLGELVKFFPGMFFYAVGGDFYIKVSSNRVKNLLFFLKNHTNTLFKELIDLSCVDYVEKKRRFEVFYNLLSVKYNTRLTVTTHVSEGSSIDSVASVYLAAN